jgi:hypothetical protein
MSKERTLGVVCLRRELLVAVALIGVVVIAGGIAAVVGGTAKNTLGGLTGPVIPGPGRVRVRLARAGGRTIGSQRPRRGRFSFVAAPGRYVVTELSGGRPLAAAVVRVRAGATAQITLTPTG